MYINFIHASQDVTERATSFKITIVFQPYTSHTLFQTI